MKLQKFSSPIGALSVALLLLAAVSPVQAGWKEWISEKSPSLADSLGIEKQAQEAKISVTLCVPKETKAWVQAALPGFRDKYPNLKDVKLVLQGSGSLMQSMNDGNTSSCDLVGAASTVSAYSWEGFDPQQATSIAMSELIIAMTAENKRDLEKALGAPVSVRNIAGVGNKKWRDVGVDRKGKIRIEFTNPDLSNSGRVALVTAAYSYHETYDPLDPDMVEDEGFQTFMRTFWDNTKHKKKSTTDLTNKLRSQPSRYTAIFTYGNKIPDLKRTFGDDLRVLVPEYTVMNDYPMVITASDEAHKTVARAWIQYMVSAPVQRMATDKFFFRPVNPDVRTGAALAQVVPDKELAPVDFPEPENRGVIEAILDIARGED